MAMAQDKPEVPAACASANPTDPICKDIKPGCPGSTSTDPIPASFDPNSCPYRASGAARCETGDNSLAWGICPMINLLADAADGIYSNFIKPQLQTTPVRIDSANPIFQVWSNLRIFGNILLIIGILVIVFGQSIGGGMIDAYTAKKVLPRIFIAGILINLSIYIVALMVDFTNILGGGLNTLLVEIAGSRFFSLNAPSAGGGAPVISVVALVTAAVAGFALLKGAGSFILLFILLPGFLAFLGVMATLLIRQGLIIALIIISPVAFALYCLPNTETYFKKWWKYLFEALLVYPIIALVFGVANLLALTLNWGNSSGGLSNAFASIGSLIMLFLPLFLIPFAFKLAGGALGNLYGTVAGWNGKGSQFLKGNPNDPNSAGNQARYKFQSARLSTRGRMYDKVDAATKIGSGGRAARARRLMARPAAAALGMGNLQAKRADFNRRESERIATQTGNGNDENIRALWATQFRGTDAEGPANGRVVGGYYSPYQSADGSYKEFALGDVKKAQALVAQDPSRFQEFARYEFGKAADNEQIDTFRDRFLDVAKENNINKGDLIGAWAGIKFAHQGARKELKYMNFDADTMQWGDINNADFSREMVDSMKTHEIAGFRPSTARDSLRLYKDARDRLKTHSIIQKYDQYRQTGQYNGDWQEDQKLLYERYGGKTIQEENPGISNADVQTRLLAAARNDTSAAKISSSAKASENWKLLASNLESRFYMDAKARGGAMQDAQYSKMREEEGGASAGYGLGASARAEAAWKEFVDEYRKDNPKNGGQGKAAA